MFYTYYLIHNNHNIFYNLNIWFVYKLIHVIFINVYNYTYNYSKEFSNYVFTTKSSLQ